MFFFSHWKSQRRVRHSVVGAVGPDGKASADGSPDEARPALLNQLAIELVHMDRAVEDAREHWLRVRSQLELIFPELRLTRADPDTDLWDGQELRTLQDRIDDLCCRLDEAEAKRPPRP
ncbi:hypothetical protein [Arthrobacter sp. UM1]|uniref:hypothetical protein n=1 Tax=Arthrobacter sp. UM1 TaxID=2766776 RepID=UPI001CF6B779|nr:hypothetical protein [Arthrobacter sp. UM1]MCB4207895.1 hypothetical protein [Arthrobacter sp. UM1]